MGAEAVLTKDSAARTVAALFPPDTGVGACVIGQAGPMPGVEAAAMARAVPARRAEFAAGRHAARQAMVRLGLPAQPVPMGEDRAPLWPAGVTGSITHHGALALAVACRAGTRTLGLDAEPDEDLPGDLLDQICDSDERDWIAGCDRPLRWARLVFAAKEAAYKCQYPLSRTLFGFDAMTVRVDPVAGTLAARFLRPVAPFAAGRVLHGRFAFAGGLVIAGFSLPWEQVGADAASGA